MDEEKVLTYEEAKHLCALAFDGGAIYGSESMRYHCDAAAYDWEHWLKKNERLFRPKPTVEDVLFDSLKHFGAVEERTPSVDEWLHEQAKRLRLAEKEAGE